LLVELRPVFTTMSKPPYFTKPYHGLVKPILCRNITYNRCDYSWHFLGEKHIKLFIVQLVWHYFFRVGHYFFLHTAIFWSWTILEKVLIVYIF
jgi:hypothetical protein